MKAALALGCDDPADLDLRAQELLLSGPAQGLPDLAVRAAVRAGGPRPLAVRRRGARRAHHPRPHGRGRRQVAARHAGGGDRHLPRLQPRRHAARRDRHRAGHPLRRRRRRLLQPPARRADDGRRQRRQPRRGQPALRRQRLGASRRRRPTLGTKVEIKNLNSFRFVQKAIEYEIARQSAVVRDGGRIVQETRLWDADAGCTESMRSKEEAHDYRYFPEPDLPPLAHRRGRRRALAGGAAGAARRDARARSSRSTALPAYDAGVLTQSAALARFFEQTAAAAGNPKAASNWIMGELLRLLRASRRRRRALTTVTPDGARRADPARRRRHDQRPDGEGGLRDDVRVGPRARRDRHDRRPRAGERRRRGAGHRARGDRPRGRCRGAVPQGQAGGDRLPHRSGDEGGQGQGQPEARRQPAGARARAARMP